MTTTAKAPSFPLLFVPEGWLAPLPFLPTCRCFERFERPIKVALYPLPHSCHEKCGKRDFFNPEVQPLPGQLDICNQFVTKAVACYQVVGMQVVPHFVLFAPIFPAKHPRNAVSPGADGLY